MKTNPAVAVGDQVRLVDMKEYWRNDAKNWEGKTATVTGFDSNGDFNFVWNHTGKSDPKPYRWRFVKIDHNLDVSKVKHTRSGLPVANIEKSDDLTRPITAEVFVGRNWLTLSYQNDGRFVSRFDQPIDLVEAQ